MVLNHIVSQYREAFLKHGNSPDAVLWPKGRQQLRFSRLTSHFCGEGFSVLDFGCGLAHLRAYLGEHFSSFTYTGVDLVPEFVDECRSNFPKSDFAVVSDVQDITQDYDYVVLSGVFNIQYLPDRNLHLGKVFHTLEHLFRRSRIALSCDFMTDKVDFQAAGAFHMSEPELIGMVQQKMTLRYSIDHTYMPYEFALIAHKDQRIVRPTNTYSGIPDEDLSR